MNYIIKAGILALLLSGCATEYAAKGITGGYTDLMTGPNTAVVTFMGNGFTSAGTVQRFALKRAAQLTLNNGYDYFLVEDGQNYVSQSDPGGTIQCRTYGYNTTCRESAGFDVPHPRSRLEIRMFSGETPNQTGYYDARYLR